jgi:predicted DCC family thiol-disulfide oxidoreductase YuxK
MKEDEKIVLLFDGVCNFCNDTVNFILTMDKNDRFRFATLQSEIGKNLLGRPPLNPKESESVVLIEKGKVYRYSSAGLRIAKNLGGGWSLLYIFILVPPFIRDAIYKWIARNRYKWFGKRDSCRMPDEKTKSKFLSS